MNTKSTIFLHLQTAIKQLDISFQKITLALKKIISIIPFRKITFFLFIFLLLVFVISAAYLYRNSLFSFGDVSGVDSRQKNLNSAQNKQNTTKAINRSFTFNTETSGSLSKIGYTILDAQTKDSVLIKGQKATPVDGKTFLILNLKLDNSSNDQITFNSRDFVRLSSDGGNTWIAADIYNDPLEIDPISSRFTELGFIIDKSQKDFKIKVGEIAGNKTTIDLKLL